MSDQEFAASDFLNQVIRPALTAIGQDSPAAEQLLLATALQESDLRTTVQMGGGPALGYFQMEPATHDDIWANFLRYRAELASGLRRLAGIAAGVPHAGLLASNHRYAAAMTRVHYMRVPAPLPAAGDAAAMAAYWKDHYNTAGGAGSTAQFLRKWANHRVAALVAELV
ncbi:MAG TPA: hypothetical protein VFN42_10225 [Acetobacteraceae bacterium]|nr:hypothetical protein [Acetobacteraceae bacterium]